MFIDSVQIEVIGGNGGNGIIAFRREKYVPLGGPAGGSGGRGGDVIFKVDTGLRTLLDYRYNRKYQAQNGENGKNKGMHGGNSEDLILRVPPGTVVYNDETDEIIFDLVKPEQTEKVAKGGRGGRGNLELAKAGKHALEISENGEPGEFLKIRLELKLISDVGLVGLPSVGKSSLISVVSKAKPKIAAYHFTTLNPKLGVVRTKDNRTFVASDLPGLIEGAHLGKGLGLEFLKHIERTRVILHVLDMGSFEGRDPIDDFEKINKELLLYNMGLENKKMIVVANKMDLVNSAENLEKFKNKYEKIKVFPISTVTKIGIEELLLYTADILDKLEEENTYEEQSKQKIYEYEKEIDFDITIDKNGVYIVTGTMIKKLIAMTNFNTYDNIRRLSNQLKNYGINDALTAKGAKNGDIVLLENIEFEFNN